MTTTVASSPPAERTRRRWITSTAVCVAGALVVARLPAGALVDAAAANRSDGVTYCWQVGGSAYASDFNSSVAIQEAQQDDCAVALTLQLTKDAFFVGEAIEASWTATLRRDPASGGVATNKFGMQELFVAQDRVSQKPFEILFSRVESCAATTPDCDPVVGHSDLISTVTNKPANFTAAGLALFSTDRIAFSSAGSVRLIAHLVLPGESPEQSRLDFAFYKTVAINERPTLSPVRNESGSSQSEKDSSAPTATKGLSTQVIGIMFVCGMVAVALVAAGFVMIRKNRTEVLPPVAVQKGGPDGRTRHDASSTDLDDEFAMLSNEERFMQSQNGTKKTGGGFLTATARPPSMLEESRAKAKGEAPLPYVGHASTRGGGGAPRNGGVDVDLASDDHIVDPSNPASMRHHGLYMEMPAQQQQQQSTRGPSQIYYNDIRDDEIIGHALPPVGRRTNPNPNPAGMGMSTRGSSMNPYAAARESRRLADGRTVAERLGSPINFAAEPAASADHWRVSTELTFDDLRPSADLGPALTLDDLLESKQMKKKRGTKSDSLSES